jgi:site-specific DNA recombinase
MRRAVILLRVSGDSQTKRDGAEQGYSFEYQRDRCYEEAAKREADVVREFVAPAESASNGMYRTLREALDYVKEDDHIDYFIVYMLDRFIRDELVQFQTYAELRAAGTDLVSATEKIDNTPAGLLQMAMLAGVNAYRSRNDAIKIKDGMRKKAELGGTPTRTKLGYLNKQRMDGRNSIRYVVLDPDRHHHMQYAFQAFATGEWSISTLVDELYERGLRSNPGGRAPGKVGRSALHRLLRDPYYKGVVAWQGIEYKGTHPRLVSDELWERVQQILDGRSQGRDNAWRHRHYVKGSVFCSLCGERLLFTKVTGNGGTYDYFMCAGRHRGRGCRLPYLPAAWLEQEMTRYYRQQIAQFADRVAAIKPQLIEQFGLLTEHQREHAAQWERDIGQIEAQRSRLVADRLANPDAIPLDVLEEQQAELQSSLVAAKAKLARAKADFGKSEAGLETAHELLSNLPGSYEAVDPETRRRFIQAIFKKLFVGPEGVERAELADDFQELLNDELPGQLEKIAGGPKSSHFEVGLNLEPLVPPAGFEPAPRGLKGRRSNQLSYRGARPMVDGCPRSMRSRFGPDSGSNPYRGSGKLRQALRGGGGLGVGAAGDAAGPASGMAGLDGAT